MNSTTLIGKRCGYGPATWVLIECFFFFWHVQFLANQPAMASPCYANKFQANWPAQSPVLERSWDVAASSCSTNLPNKYIDVFIGYTSGKSVQSLPLQKESWRQENHSKHASLQSHFGSKAFGCGICFSTMAASKPPGRPKLPTNEVLDLTNLHLDWDNNPEIRERLLDAQDLVVGGGCDDIPTAKKNTPVLLPLLTRMSLTEHRPLPGVELLRDEIEAVYMRNKRGKTAEDVPDITRDGWRIRKLLGFVKMKVRREEVSEVPLTNRFNICVVLRFLAYPITVLRCDVFLCMREV